ncbi:hypothetical protein ACFVU3_19490 [Streptomyces sp. NPDC058052]|uniref:hypothetical protein n=1 Tax=Streptomyces sp. NPDC058052 TaxID=3346316 RepID=UPI0036EF90C8
MDRAQVAANLDQIATPGGTVGIVSDSHPDNRPRDDWEPVTAEVRSRYLRPQRRAGSGTYEHLAEGHSALPVLPRRHPAMGPHHPRTLDEVIGLQFSFSYSTHTPLGDHIAEQGGKFEEHVRTEALIAARSKVDSAGGRNRPPVTEVPVA